MEYRIETLTETYLIGMKKDMSYKNNKTKELWQSFMPRVSEIQNRSNNSLYSVEVYPNNFFDSFDVDQVFEKWAAVKVNELNALPKQMIPYIVPGGTYLVFNYKGKASDAAPFYQKIFSHWLPKSPYKLDSRPHIAIMGEKYKGEHPESEEEIWIPILK